MAPPRNSGRRILVVDDEALVGDTVRRVLAEAGHKVEVVTGGLEALAALERSTFDLVITDYEMPVMKGDQLAREIKERVHGQKIVMLTAFEESLNSSHCPLSVEVVMAKPFDFRHFLLAINKLLDGNQGG